MKHILITKKKSWFRSPIVSVILIICIIWGVISVIKAYRKDDEAVDLRNQESRQLADLHEKQAQLTNQINSFSSDRGIEAEIRNRYRVERPGENLVIVVDNSTSDQVSQSPKPTLWQKIRAYIGW
jgi:cell division protein FtsB